MPVFAGPLHVHYGQAYVFSGDDGDTAEMESCFRGQANGLLGAGQPGMLFITTGLHTGSVELTVDVLEHEPSLDAVWAECVEVSFTPGATDVRLVDWDGQLVCWLPLQMRDYRVRYAAVGMDEAREADTILANEDALDSYGLWFWPAPVAPDLIVKQTSETARYWHEWARSL